MWKLQTVSILFQSWKWTCGPLQDDYSVPISFCQLEARKVRVAMSALASFSNPIKLYRSWHIWVCMCFRGTPKMVAFPQKGCPQNKTSPYVCCIINHLCMCCPKLVQHKISSRAFGSRQCPTCIGQVGAWLPATWLALRLATHLASRKGQCDQQESTFSSDSWVNPGVINPD